MQGFLYLSGSALSVDFTLLSYTVGLNLQEVILVDEVGLLMWQIHQPAEGIQKRIQPTYTQSTDMMVLAPDQNAQVTRMTAAEYILLGQLPVDASRTDKCEYLPPPCSEHDHHVASVRNGNLSHGNFRSPTIRKLQLPSASTSGAAL
ncbi:hypothetical protein EG68_09965 [Paragonimus skrjabini miyazakii]|uniref:Uncharacterized protein n=1 Tax=Paragonimus skrjabini miyazakii TaxID=59628 RepID=A0A8S9YNH4_9TREM|nr:hypothetical protein EG68_09965 [Paragonimus skrjabini miyazakii]